MAMQATLLSAGAGAARVVGRNGAHVSLAAAGASTVGMLKQARAAANASKKHNQAPGRVWRHSAALL